MGFLKKTILLTNKQDKSSKMAVVSVEKNNSGVFGTIKAYDLNYDNMVLGISVDGKSVIKQNLSFNNGNTYNFKLNNDFDINGNIGCVLVQKFDSRVVPLIWGTNGGKADYKNNIIDIFESEMTELKPKQQVVEPKTIEQDIVATTMQTSKNDAITELFEENEGEIEDLINSELEREGGDFFSLIDEQVNELFERFPSFDELEDVVPNSKWVKVDFDNDGREYIVGLLYDGGVVRYLAYGVPGDYEIEPSSELVDYSQWLPVSVENPKGDGYWVMFQDAESGENVKLDELKIS